jgi:hypothetical protein
VWQFAGIETPEALHHFGSLQDTLGRIASSALRRRRRLIMSRGCFCSKLIMMCHGSRHDLELPGGVICNIEPFQAPNGGTAPSNHNISPPQSPYLFCIDAHCHETYPIGV